MTTSFDPQDEERVRRELDEDEQLLWIERPAANEIATRSLGTSVVGVLVVVFALFWMNGAMWVTQQQHGFTPPATITHTNVPGEAPIILPRMETHSSPPGAGLSGANLFPLFGLIFVAVGVYLIVSPFLSAAKADNTVYALTDRRALIIEDSTSARVQSFGPRDIERVESHERANGLGDLIFARRLVRSGSGRHRHTHEQEIGFLSTPRVKEAERFMREYLLRTY